MKDSQMTAKITGYKKATQQHHYVRWISLFAQFCKTLQQMFFVFFWSKKKRKKKHSEIKRRRYGCLSVGGDMSGSRGGAAPLAPKIISNPTVFRQF